MLKSKQNATFCCKLKIQIKNSVNTKKYSEKYHCIKIRTLTDNPIIELLNSWIKEKLYNDFGLYHSKDVPNLIEEYIYYFNNKRFPLNADEKALFGFEPNRASNKTFFILSTFT